MTVTRHRRRPRRDYSKAHRLFVEDTPREVRAILEEAAGLLAAEPQPTISAAEGTPVVPLIDKPIQRDVGEVTAP